MIGNGRERERGGGNGEDSVAGTTKCDSGKTSTYIIRESRCGINVYHGVRFRSREQQHSIASILVLQTFFFFLFYLILKKNNDTVHLIFLNRLVINCGDIL